MTHKRRFYRSFMARPGLVSFHVMHKETDLHIQALRDLSSSASRWVIEARVAIESYAASHPGFLESLIPLSSDPLAPPIVTCMLQASDVAGVGPMAAVAGAIAEYVGMKILDELPGEVVVENGGDIFLKTKGPVTTAIYAGASPLSNRVGIRISPGPDSMGVCTSSGTIGHSRSFGTADAVTVIARSAPLADAAATAAANLVKGKNDINIALEWLRGIKGISGAVAIKQDRLGAFGDVELVPIQVNRNRRTP